MKSTRGFTLIELMIVIAIIGIVGSLILGSVTGKGFQTRQKCHEEKLSNGASCLVCLDAYGNPHPSCGAPPAPGKDSF